MKYKRRSRIVNIDKDIEYYLYCKNELKQVNFNISCTRKVILEFLDDHGLSFYVAKNAIVKKLMVKKNIVDKDKLIERFGADVLNEVIKSIEYKQLNVREIKEEDRETYDRIKRVSKTVKDGGMAVIRVEKIIDRLMAGENRLMVDNTKYNGKEDEEI